MRESQQVLEWQAEVRRSDLRRVLERRFRGPMPADLETRLSTLNDPQE